MKGKHYMEEQIISILKAHEARAKVAEMVWKHDVSEQSFYRWKSKYGGIESAIMSAILAQLAGQDLQVTIAGLAETKGCANQSNASTACRCRLFGPTSLHRDGLTTFFVSAS